MNSPTAPNPSNTPPDDPSAGPPPRDELDALLREWHTTNARRAAAGRDRLLASLAREDATGAEAVAGRIGRAPSEAEARSFSVVVRRLVLNRYSPLAAAAIVLAALLPFMLPGGKTGPVLQAQAKLPSNIVMAPEGGRLDAFDRQGNLLGPCALKHTDVHAEISGRFARVTVKQEYRNTLPEKIEAVYTFPLGERAGVDRMLMTIGDRVIEGEVKERQHARRLYEQAREAGRVASLLEQERPNIFTQSVANIEPGATVTIEISYVELVAEHDGEFGFAFPTVVSPRYIPGDAYRRERLVPLPAGAQARDGIILAAPATIARAALQDSTNGPRSAEQLGEMIAKATPIAAPAASEPMPAVWYDMAVAYPDGSGEPAVILADGRGRVGGRWFWTPTALPAAGEPFARPTSEVPDADRITPMPTMPGTRAGHDLSVSVTLDTGGPAITSLDAPLHEINRTDLARTDAGQAKRVSITLAERDAIPNRDFVLKWRQSRDAIGTRVFTNTGPNGNFFAVQLDPPAAPPEAAAVPRELVFVVDTSGSMNGRPTQLCKEVMQKAIAGMRARDTFNIVTFAGATHILWNSPRPNTRANRDEADRFIGAWNGSGGTEMMGAIEAALRQSPASATGAITPAQLADLPADGREVAVEADDGDFRSEGLSKDAVTDRAELFIREGLSIKCAPFRLPEAYLRRADQTVRDDSIVLKLLLRGAWTTREGERLFDVTSAEMSSDSGVRPLRIVMFLTDAEVGNDFAIIDAIRKHRETTRVFPFGIGNSVNRFLIEQMALAGGGEPEYIYAAQASDRQAQEAVERFNRRTKMPLLTDIRVSFAGVQPLDVLPDPGSVQDLWDNRPLTFLGRYAGAGNGSLTIKAQGATGPWERTIPLNFPERQKENSSLPTLWARAKIDALMAQDLVGAQSGEPRPEVRAQIVQLGETFNIMSQYTSFVAVEKLRVTIDGKPRLVRVPVELPDATNWKGYFGEVPIRDADRGGPAAAATGGAVLPALRLNEETIARLIDSASAFADVDGDASNVRMMLDDVSTEAVAPLAPSPALPGAPAESAAPVDRPVPTGKLAWPATDAPIPAAPAGQRQEKADMVKRSKSGRPAKAAGAPAPPPPPAPAAVSKPGAVGSEPKDVKEELSKQLSRHPARREAATAAPSEAASLGNRPQASGGASAGGVRDAEGRADGKPFAPLGARPGILALAAAQLAESGKLDEAKRIACSFPPTTNAEGVDPQVLASTNSLCRALAPDAEKDALASAIEQTRRAASDDLLAERRREIIRRKLAPEVAARVIPVASPAASSADSVVAAPDAIAARKSGAKDVALRSDSAGDGTLLVTILLADTSDATMETLKKLGAKTDAVKPEANVVVARVPLAKMEELAMLDVVRRVELASLE